MIDDLAFLDNVGSKNRTYHHSHKRRVIRAWLRLSVRPLASPVSVTPVSLVSVVGMAHSHAGKLGKGGEGGWGKPLGRVGRFPHIALGVGIMRRSVLGARETKKETECQ